MEKRVGSPELVDAWLAADEKRRAAQTAADKLKNDQKTAGEKMKQKLSPEERAQLQTSLRALKEQVQGKEKEQADAEAEANADHAPASGDSRSEFLAGRGRDDKEQCGRPLLG